MDWFHVNYYYRPTEEVAVYDVNRGGRPRDDLNAVAPGNYIRVEIPNDQFYEPIDMEHVYDNLNFEHLSHDTFAHSDQASTYSTASSSPTLSTLIDASTLANKINNGRKTANPPNSWLPYIIGAATAFWFFYRF